MFNKVASIKILKCPMATMITMMFLFHFLLTDYLQTIWLAGGKQGMGTRLHQFVCVYRCGGGQSKPLHLQHTFIYINLVHLWFIWLVQHAPRCFLMYNDGLLLTEFVWHFQLLFSCYYQTIMKKGVQGQKQTLYVMSDAVCTMQNLSSLGG